MNIITKKFTTNVSRRMCSNKNKVNVVLHYTAIGSITAFVSYYGINGIYNSFFVGDYYERELTFKHVSELLCKSLLMGGIIGWALSFIL